MAITSQKNIHMAVVPYSVLNTQAKCITDTFCPLMASVNYV